jgi:hypothetical protein
MHPTEKILEWADRLAHDLTLDMHWESSSGGGYWWVGARENRTRIRARATAAIDFLDGFAGTESRWTRSAISTLETGGERQAMETGAWAIGDC